MTGEGEEEESGVGSGIRKGRWKGRNHGWEVGKTRKVTKEEVR